MSPSGPEPRPAAPAGSVGSIQVWPARDVPALDVDQMRKIDRFMVDELHIDLVQMMENAGRSLADLVVSRISPSTVTVLAGPGGNGDGGMAAARHLANRGTRITVVLSRPDALTTVPAHQADVLGRMGIPMPQDPQPADLIVDALVGYSLRGDPPRADGGADRVGERPSFARPFPRHPQRVGRDERTGRRPERARHGQLDPCAAQGGLLGGDTVGELYLGDVSVPPWLYERVGVQRPRAFGHAGVVRLER
jgi:NAD(P)H-hydrate epimerase